MSGFVASVSSTLRLARVWSMSSPRTSTSSTLRALDRLAHALDPLAGIVRAEQADEAHDLPPFGIALSISSTRLLAGVGVVELPM